jgi:hypothetical protein
MTKLYQYVCIGLLVINGTAISAEINCDTTFDQFIPAGGTIEDVYFSDLDDWITALKDDDCAWKVLNSYNGLPEVVGTYSPGAKLDEVEIVNKASALASVLRSILTNENFYGDMENKIMENLPTEITIATMPSLIFTIQSVTEDGNALIGQGSNHIDKLIVYRTACIDASTSSCKEWERYIRFIAAMTYAVADISESQSKLKLKTLENGLTRYIGYWDNYYTQRKPQLPWELLANEIWNRDVRKSAYFPKPPSSDLILFHPQLVYTRFDTEDSEAEISSTLLWEVVGINFWDKSLLTGASIVSSNLKSSGSLGVMVTLKNKYSLGVIDKDDDETWFVSVDLFDFFTSKKNEFEKTLKDRLQKLESTN